MNAIGFAFLTIALVCVIACKKQTALLAMAAGYLYITQNQGFELLGFNFFAYRFIEIAAFIRVLLRKEFQFAQCTRVDWAVIGLFVVTTGIFVIRSKDGLGYQIGSSLDCILSYIAFRGLIDGTEDVVDFLKRFVVVLAPFALGVILESLTKKNFFHVAEDLVTTDMYRAGRLRCQGSFRHPSLMGTLGATFFPLYAGMVAANFYRWRAMVGLALCVAIVWASNSGGPISCLAVGVAGCGLWLMRDKMRLFRWATIGAIGLLTMAMKAPIWYVLARVSDFSGGDGWHRSFLLDVAFKNLDKWWLAGMPILDTANWFPYDAAATGGADITNQFLYFGLVAGLASMLLFIWLIVLCFKLIGPALKARMDVDSSEQYVIWSMGVMLSVHISNWLGITYFDQTYAFLMLQLATLVAVCTSSPMGAPEPVGSDPFEAVSGDVPPRGIGSDDPVIPEPV